MCKFCGVEETVKHLLFQCPIARATCWVRNSLGWPSAPTSITNFQDLLLLHGDGDGETLMWWVMAAVGWALWKTRNDLVLQISRIDETVDKASKEGWSQEGSLGGEANEGDGTMVICA